METRKYYWTMKDGNKIDVDDMTETHLKNVLKMLLRRNESSAKKLHMHNVSKRCFCGVNFDGIQCSMEKALNWWYNILTDEERSDFPKPKDNDDILAYYTDPAENINLDYITYKSLSR